MGNDLPDTNVPVSLSWNYVNEVEIQGQILGKGIGTTWEDAKLQVFVKEDVQGRCILGRISLLELDLLVSVMEKFSQA